MNEETGITVIGVAMIVAIVLVVLWVLKTLTDQKVNGQKPIEPQ
ncbi:MAG TPA: hypothetical protein VKB26_04750 [Candidatus Acidoferrales bacterium]|nr:hypothetical protein [Candidatus Acidoferrales bacterium]